MNEGSRHILVIGHGAAGLAAALAAAETAQTRRARAQGRAARITLIDKAPEADAGGNTRWTPAYMRMAAVDRVEPSFVHDMLEATQFRGDEAYFATLAEQAPATVKWIAAHGVNFHQPVYYLAKGPPRIQPVGGGETIHRELTRAAREAGIALRYACAVESLVAQDGAVVGVRLAGGETLAADAVVLCCGGFQANPTMMREHFGEGGESVPLLAPRARFNGGDGIRMALALGADFSGEPNGMHCEPVDPRSRNQAPVVLLYPYGIVVDASGQRFFDEGAGLVHETWETFSRRLHFDVPGRTAYAILDARHAFGGAAIRRRDARRSGGPHRRRCRQPRPHRRRLQRGLHRRSGTIRCDSLRRPCRLRGVGAAEIELGACHHRAAVPRLADDRCHRLYVRRAFD